MKRKFPAILSLARHLTEKGGQKKVPFVVVPLSLSGSGLAPPTTRGDNAIIRPSAGMWDGEVLLLLVGAIPVVADYVANLFEPDYRRNGFLSQFAEYSA